MSVRSLLSQFNYRLFFNALAITAFVVILAASFCSKALAEVKSGETEAQGYIATSGQASVNDSELELVEVLISGMSEAELEKVAEPIVIGDLKCDPMTEQRCRGRGGNDACCLNTSNCGVDAKGDASCKNPCSDKSESACSVRNELKCCAKGTHCLVTPDPTGRNDQVECVKDIPQPPTTPPTTTVCTDFPSGRKCCDENYTPFPEMCCPNGSIYNSQLKSCVDVKACDPKAGLFCGSGAICLKNQFDMTWYCSPRIT